MPQPEEIFIDVDKLSRHGLTHYYIKLDEGAKTRKLTDLIDILGRFHIMNYLKDESILIMFRLQSLTKWSKS